jgi:hypothetical protein
MSPPSKLRGESLYMAIYPHFFSSPKQIFETSTSSGLEFSGSGSWELEEEKTGQRNERMLARYGVVYKLKTRKKLLGKLGRRV